MFTQAPCLLALGLSLLPLLYAGIQATATSIPWPRDVTILPQALGK